MPNGYVSQIQINGGDVQNIGSCAYAVCDTAEDVSVKVVTLPGFVLKDGATIHVKFMYRNIAFNPKLNVNGTGGKTILLNTNSGFDSSLNLSSQYNVDQLWMAGAVVTLTYDGTYWVVNNPSRITSPYTYNLSAGNTIEPGSYMILADIEWELCNSSSSATARVFPFKVCMSTMVDGLYRDRSAIMEVFVGGSYNKKDYVDIMIHDESEYHVNDDYVFDSLVDSIFIYFEYEVSSSNVIGKRTGHLLGKVPSRWSSFQLVPLTNLSVSSANPDEDHHFLKLDIAHSASSFVPSETSQTSIPSGNVLPTTVGVHRYLIKARMKPFDVEQISGVQPAITVTTNTSTPADNDTVIMQASGTTNTTTFLRRTMSKIWEYIKSKADSVYLNYGFVSTPGFLRSQYRIYDWRLHDFFYALNERVSDISLTVYDATTDEVVATHNEQLSKLFDGHSETYDNTFSLTENQYVIVRILANSFTIFCGSLFLGFYYKMVPSVDPIVRMRKANNVWETLTGIKYNLNLTGDVSGNCFYVYRRTNDSQIYEIEIKYQGRSDKEVYLSNVGFFRDRGATSSMSAVTKHAIKQTLYGEVEAPKFIKRGGTSSELLAANGDSVALPLAVNKGGTGATTALNAEYNLITKPRTTELTTAIDDDKRIPFCNQNPSTSIGTFAGYRKASSFWTYIQGKISSVLGIGDTTISTMQSSIDTLTSGKQDSTTITTNTSTPTDNDTVIMQASGTTNTTTFLRKTMSKIWDYIKSKADELYWSKDIINMSPMFNNNKFVFNSTLLNDFLYGADVRFRVTWKTYDSSDDTEITSVTNNISNLFNGNNGNYGVTPITGQYDLITIDREDGTDILYHTGGFIVCVFYNRSGPDPSNPPIVKIWTGSDMTERTLTATAITPNGTDTLQNYYVYKVSAWNSLRKIQIKIIGKTQGSGNDRGAHLANLYYIATRSHIGDQSVVTKHANNQSLYGNVTAPKFIKRGGTSQQVLLANGATINMPSTTGTNKDTLLKNLISGLSAASADVTDTTQIVTSYAGANGFSTTGYVNVPYKRPATSFWNYIQSKISSVLGLTSTNYGGTSAKATSDASGNDISTYYQPKLTLPLSVTNGGTGASDTKTARSNLLSDATEATTDTSDGNLFAFMYQTPSADNGAIYYRTADKVWNWIIGKITAGTGLSKSGNTINHSNSVTAQTSNLGSSVRIPAIKYDAQGHITYGTYYDVFSSDQYSVIKCGYIYNSATSGSGWMKVGEVTYWTGTNQRYTVVISVIGNHVNTYNDFGILRIRLSNSSTAGVASSPSAQWLVKTAGTSTRFKTDCIRMVKNETSSSSGVTLSIYMYVASSSDCYNFQVINEAVSGSTRKSHLLKFSNSTTKEVTEPAPTYVSSMAPVNLGNHSNCLEITDSNWQSYLTASNAGGAVPSSILNADILTIPEGTSQVFFNTTTEANIALVKGAGSLGRFPRNGVRITIAGNWRPQENGGYAGNNAEGRFSQWLYTLRGGSPSHNWSYKLNTVFEDFLYFNGVWYSKGY